MWFRPALSLTIIISLTGSASSSAQESCAHRFGFFTASTAHKFAEYQKKYWREVKDSWGGRLVIRPRELSKGGEGVLNTINNFMMNPIATTFNRPRQLTIPASMAGYFAIVETPLTLLEKHEENSLIAHAEKKLETFPPPGHELLADLEKAGLLSKLEKSKLILAAWPGLEKWNKDPAKRTERLAEFVKLGDITEAQATAVDKVMRNLFRTHFDDRSKEGWAKLGNEFSKALREMPELQNLKAEDRTLLTTAFFPLVKLQTKDAGFVAETLGEKDTSDLELMRTLNRSSAEDPNPALALTVALLDKNQISYSDALALALGAKSPDSLAKKAEKARSILGNRGATIGQRADIPSLSAPITFSGRDLEDELDRWKLLQEDPRLARIKDAWSKGEIDEVFALREIDGHIMGRKSFSVFDSFYAGKKVDLDGAKMLFGLDPSTPPNPLIIEARAALAGISAKIGPQKTQICLVELANFWRDYYAEEEKLRKRSRRFAKDLDAFVAAKTTVYGGVQRKCVE